MSESINRELLAALEKLRTDCQVTIDQYHENGPPWTSRETGHEYYDASYVIESNEEQIAIITTAIANAKSAEAGA